MSGELLLGIDVGTTYVKAAVVTADGRERSHGRSRTPWDVVPTGAEIDPHAFVETAVRSAREALAGAPEGRVVAVGVTGMAETGVVLDAGGQPLAPAIAWHDARGREEADALAADLGERFTETTGLPPTALWSLVKYRWMRSNWPETARGVRWLSVGEWVVRSLGGEETAELSLASRTGFLDVARAGWWEETLAWAQAPRAFLPEPAPAGTPAGRVGRGLPEAEGAILTVAGHDHLCAAAGAGATRSDDVFDSCGTAEAFVRGLEAPLPAGEVRRAVAGGVTVGRHVLPGRFALLGGFESGLALQRILSLLGVAGEERRLALDEAALALPTGAEGVSVLAITQQRATIAGVPHRATPAHVWRAALEAVAACGADMLATIESVAGETGRIVVTGGGARNEAVRTIKRSALGPFEEPPVEEAGARGAALAGGCAAGLYPSLFELPPLEPLEVTA